MTYSTLQTETHDGVRHIVLSRPEAFNAITVALRDELEQAVDAADTDPDVRVILLRAEGPAFCAGFGLDWSPEEQDARERHGDDYTTNIVSDLQRIGSFARVFSKLRECSVPTLAAIQGYCIAGGTDLAFNCDIILCSEDASFGYPPARVWGVPEQPWLWVARLGAQAAKRYLFTGDEIPAQEAQRLGLVWDVVPRSDLDSEAQTLAARMARLPRNQLQMLKLTLKQVEEGQYDIEGSRRLGCMFDGAARHTREGKAFVARAMEVGWRGVVRERDAPFGDYGEAERDADHG